MKKMKTEILAEGEWGRALTVFPEFADDPKATADFYRGIALIPNQTHSLNVGIADEGNDAFPETDALITFRSGEPIGVVTADCVPILIYCPDIRGAAAVHAGWRGTLGGIVEKVIDRLIEYGADPHQTEVFFGPSISKEAYEVDRELATRFEEAGFGGYISWPDGREGKPHLDLHGVNAERLRRRGVPKDHIRLHPGCSYLSVNPDGTPRYASHRRSVGSPARNLSLIALK